MLGLETVTKVVEGIILVVEEEIKILIDKIRKVRPLRMACDRRLTQIIIKILFKAAILPMTTII